MPLDNQPTGVEYFIGTTELINGASHNKTKVTKVASTRDHRARLLKYYPRPPCAPSFVKSRMLRPLQTHFLIFQQISFVLVCIRPGTPRVPPRVLASGPKPCGGQLSVAHNPAAVDFNKNKVSCRNKICWISMYCSGLNVIAAASSECLPA